MKLKNKLVVVIAILLFITIHHTFSKQEITVAKAAYPSVKTKDTNICTELLDPSNIILVKLP